jgi:hypothetical protein
MDSPRPWFEAPGMRTQDIPLRVLQPSGFQGILFMGFRGTLAPYMGPVIP